MKTYGIEICNICGKKISINGFGNYQHRKKHEREAQMTTLTKNGISTTKEKDCFRYEEVRGTRNLYFIQWDYRDKNGKLHSGIANTLEQAANEARKFGYKF